jgi:hypothetical protein
VSKSSKPSKFNAVFQHRQEESLDIGEIDQNQDTNAESPEEEIETGETAPDISQSSTVETLVPSSPPPKKIGRPSGKRSDPNYTQVTAYIKSQTYRDVKVALLLGEEKQEFSELIEHLLVEWLSTQKLK